MKFLQSFLFTAAFSLSSQIALAADIDSAPTSSGGLFGYIGAAISRGAIPICGSLIPRFVAADPEMAGMGVATWVIG